MAARSRGENAPARTKVESVDLDHVIHLASGWDSWSNFPTPAGLLSEGAPGLARGYLELGVFPEEPVEEALQGEELAAVGSFPDRRSTTLRAFPALGAGRVLPVLHEPHVA